MNRNKAQDAALENKLTAAIAEHFTGSAVLTLNGVSYKAKDLQKTLQAHVDASSAADALEAKWRTAVATANAKAATVAGLLPALRAHLISEYGGSSQTVADFGFTPKKRTTTVDAQALGVARRAATRQARGTKGKKQKAAIVGVVQPAASTAPAEAPKPATGTGTGTTPPAAAS
ncbi:MAG: hypothetical protein ACLQVI_08965 [Polyangiaceae bacterium]